MQITTPGQARMESEEPAAAAMGGKMRQSVEKESAFLLKRDGKNEVSEMQGMLQCL